MTCGSPTSPHIQAVPRSRWLKASARIVPHLAQSCCPAPYRLSEVGESRAWLPIRDLRKILHQLKHVRRVPVVRPRCGYNTGYSSPVLTKSVRMGLVFSQQILDRRVTDCLPFWDSSLVLFLRRSMERLRTSWRTIRNGVPVGADAKLQGLVLRAAPYWTHGPPDSPYPANSRTWR